LLRGEQEILILLLRGEQEILILLLRGKQEILILLLRGKQEILILCLLRREQEILIILVILPPLLRGTEGVSDDELKPEYLNYLKWTEPLALMLELVEDEAQAVRVVRLALEVDLRLGASLAGAVKPEC
jgi:hypothetical protein